MTLSEWKGIALKTATRKNFVNYLRNNFIEREPSHDHIEKLKNFLCVTLFEFHQFSQNSFRSWRNGKKSFSFSLQPFSRSRSLAKPEVWRLLISALRNEMLVKCWLYLSLPRFLDGLDTKGFTLAEFFQKSEDIEEGEGRSSFKSAIRVQACWKSTCVLSLKFESF